MASSGWFASLGYWKQEEAYSAFDLYRDNPNDEAIYLDAVEKAIPLIRVVYSTQKFKVTYDGDEDDFIAHAAYTITKAIPKMIEKPKEKLDNDKKYMRYLFTCVINAFYREYDVLHGKQNKLMRKIDETSPSETTASSPNNIMALEAELTLKRIPPVLVEIAMESVRFEGTSRKICQYILNQRVNGREVAKSVLQLMGCKDRNFFMRYCDSVLLRSFLVLRSKKSLLEDLRFEGLSSLDETEEMFDLGMFLETEEEAWVE